MFRAIFCILCFSEVVLPQFNIQTVWKEQIPASISGPSIAISAKQLVGDTSGNLYFPAFNRILRLNSTGHVSVFAGDGSSEMKDGAQALESGIIADALAMGPGGKLYIASGCEIYTISSGLLQKVAGGDCTALFGQLSGSAGLAVDASGIIYTTNQFDCVIRKIQNGVISVFAGIRQQCTYSGDGGPATQAKLFWPTGLAVDSSGDVYIADTTNRVVRKVSAATGTISTVAGTGQGPIAGFVGEGGPATSAKLAAPLGLSFDPSGALLIGDLLGVRKVSGGIITTIAGATSSGFSGDGGSRRWCAVCLRIYVSRCFCRGDLR